jgi:copper ion binding protein
MAQIIFTIPKISCGHCVETITQAVHPLDGVDQVSVDIQSKQVEVDYDETRTTIDRIKNVLAQKGYPVISARTGPGEKHPDQRVAGCSCCGA